MDVPERIAPVPEVVSDRSTLVVAIAALAVVAGSFVAAGDVLAGAIAATQYSARFSALVFAFALMARAGRPPFLAARKVQLTIAFVIAHGVHYATVAARAVVEPGNHLRQFSLEPLLIVAGGTGLVAVLAWTARGGSTARERTQAVVFYALGAVLALALGSRAVTPATHPSSAAVFVVLLAAFAWRLGWALKRRR